MEKFVKRQNGKSPFSGVVIKAVVSVFTLAALCCGCSVQPQNASSRFIDPAYVPPAYEQARAQQEQQRELEKQQLAKAQKKQPFGFGTDANGNHYLSIPGLVYFGQKKGNSPVNPGDYIRVNVGTYPVKGKNFPGSGIKTRVDTNWSEPNGYDDNGSPRFNDKASHYDSNSYKND